MDPHQPLLRDTPLDDQQLVRYLLGLLPPHEADRFDEASVVDDAVAVRLRGVEDDLVDAYVRGTLAIDLRERFESHYLASPRRRERVAFAAAFARAVDERPRPAALPWWRPRWMPALLPVLAIAAALLLVASAGLLFESVRLGRGLSLAESDRAALDQRARDLEPQNADLRTANADIAQQLALARTPVAAAAQDVKAIALVLLPQTRSVGAVPVLDLPAAPAGGRRPIASASSCASKPTSSTDTRSGCAIRRRTRLSGAATGSARRHRPREGRCAWRFRDRC